MNNESEIYPKRVEVLLTEKQYRYLEIFNLMKGKPGLSASVRNIIEEHRKNHK